MSVTTGLYRKQLFHRVVAGVAVIPLLTWLFRNRSNHPRRGLWPRLPLLSKEGSWNAEVRD